MTATLSQDVMQLARPELLTATAGVGSLPPAVVDLPALRDHFPNVATVAPPAPFTPAFGPHRGAHLYLAAVVAGCVYSLEGRV